MCCLFGFVDYTGALSVNQKKSLDSEALYRGRSSWDRCYWYCL